ncbi:MAG TPA: hypothetical protein VGQ82_03590 [Chthoniobacterales bacterium]|nr:hypothetical protein [Chthoniobacterales bacterium]
MKASYRSFTRHCGIITCCVSALLLAGCAEPVPAGERIREEGAAAPPPVQGPLGQRVDPTGEPQR